MAEKMNSLKVGFDLTGERSRGRLKGLGRIRRHDTRIADALTLPLVCLPGT